MNKLSKRRWRLLPLLAALAAGCDLPGQPKRPAPADEATQFNALYTTHCAGCHGADGKLGPAPPLNDPIFLAIVPDAELLRVITEGRTEPSHTHTAGQRLKYRVQPAVRDGQRGPAD